MWGLDESGALLACTRDVINWEPRKAADALASIGAALDGTVYAVDVNGTALTYQDDAWTAAAKPPAPLATVSVGSASVVWGVDVKGRLLSLDAGPGQWNVVDGPDGPGTAVTSVAVTLDESVFCLSAEGIVYTRDGAGWTGLGVTRKFTALAASEGGWIWAVGTDGSLAQYDGQAWMPVGTPAGEALRRVACGTDLTVWTLDGAGRLWQFDAAHQAWLPVAVPAPLSDIALGAVYEAWAIGTDGSAYQYTRADAFWDPAGAPGLYTSIAAVNRDTVWALTGEAAAAQVTVLRQQGGVWSAEKQIAGPVDIAAGVDGSVWGVGPTGSVLEFDSAGGAWRTLPAAPAPARRVSAGDAASLTILDGEGKAYRFNASSSDWTLLTGGDPDAGFVDIAAIPGGGVWAVAADGSLCVWLESWVAGAGPDTAVTAGGASNVWVLDAQSRPLPVTGRGFEGDQSQAPDLPGWDAESVFGELRSTHLWIVNRAIRRAAAEGGAIGQWLTQVLQPGAGNNGDPLHTMMCQGLYDADFVPPYNWPIAGFATYASHFYDPTTGRNWLGFTSPTALTEGTSHFEASVTAYLAGRYGGTDGAGYQLGLALHYMTDVTQPMHASNFTALDSHPFPGYHTDYEGFVLQIQRVVEPHLKTYPLPDLGPNPGDHIRGAAQTSRPYLADLVGSDETKYYKTFTGAEAVTALRTGPELLGRAIGATAAFLLEWGARTYRRPAAWEDHGQPEAGVTAVTGIGATATLGDNRPYLFAKGSDGDLWVRWYQGTQTGWTWTRQTTPPAPISSGLGAVCSSHGPAAFMLGQNGEVLAQWWEGASGQWNWTDLGTPPGEGGTPGRVVAAAVAAQPAGDSALFVLTGTGVLYKNQVPDNQWEQIAAPPTTCAVSMVLGATTTTPDTNAALVRCLLVATTDGQVWVWQEQQYSQGTWAQVGPPQGRTVTAGLGVGADVLAVQCDDGQVYWCDWDPAGGGQWFLLGAVPDDLTVSSGLAVNIAAFPLDYPFVMVRTAEGPVVLASYYNQQAVWDDRGAPGETTPVSTVGFVYFQRDFLTAVVGADGHLWA